LEGVPAIGLDALASCAYGPEAALAVLIPLGAAGVGFIVPIVAAIIALLAILYFSYRQTIAAYPNGGGSYTVAKENLGEGGGLVAIAASLRERVYGDDWCGGRQQRSAVLPRAQPGAGPPHTDRDRVHPGRPAGWRGVPVPRARDRGHGSNAAGLSDGAVAP